MRRFFLTLTLALSALLAFAGGTSTFEGVIMLNYKSSDNSGNGKLQLSVKGNNIFIDPTVDPNMANSPTMYMNASSRDMTILAVQGEQKVALQFNLDVLDEIGGASKFVPSYGFDMQSPDLKIEKTSETKEISGYKCTKYTYKDADTEGEFWLTTDMGFSLATLFGRSVTNEVLQSGMVMEASGKEKDSGKTFSYTLDVVEKEVPSSLFKVPSGYQPMNMTALIQQMIQAQGPEAVKKMFDQMVPK